jgi:SAM-dependent methyltransferase
MWLRMNDAVINKTMDRDDLSRPDIRLILLELFALMRRMNRRGADYSSWYGRSAAWPSAWEHINRDEHYLPHPENPDELRIPWFLLWEIAWLITHTPLPRAARILDMGGAGSLFTCLLAARGHEVHSIDLQESLCRKAQAAAQKMNWRLHPRQMDMTNLDYPPEHFDAVFSVCVFEHLPVSGRIACNREVARVLRPRGTAAYTFDYANPQSFGRLDTPDDVLHQFVIPSGLAMRGDERFHDNGKRYLDCPQCFGFGRLLRAAARAHAAITGSVQPVRALTGRTSYTMGAVFLEKS